MSGYSLGVRMRRKLIAGNWKMNGNLASNDALLRELLQSLTTHPGESVACNVAICAPAPYLAQCQKALSHSRIAWGAQDLSAHESGAYTGEVSGAMLKDFGCHYVIVGHSERRAYHAETDAQVAQKTLRALESGLTPIICVGETSTQRDAGQTEQVVGAQIDAVLAAISASDVQHSVVAYEPVWAIGTGKTATPAMAQQVHAFLRGRISASHRDAAARVAILYGGSMKPDNAKELLAMPDIDGGLIGGAALKAEDFLAIVAAASPTE